MTRRHRWGEKDVCLDCALRRDGYSGGRTGSLVYTWPDGHTTGRAFECPGAPLTGPKGTSSGTP
jgi:hypothetical protein